MADIRARERHILQWFVRRARVDGLHQRQHFRSRKSHRDQLLELRLRRVLSLREKLVSILDREIGGQQDHGGHVQPPVGDGVEDPREL